MSRKQHKLEHYTEDELGRIYLHDAVYADDLDAVRDLLGRMHPSHIEDKSKGGFTALHVAVLNARDSRILALLLERGADPNTTDNLGETPLNAATRWAGAGSGEMRRAGQEVLELLLADPRTDINKGNAEGYGPLHYAVMLCRPELVEYLVAKGADVHLKAAGGKTPLDVLSEESCSERKKGAIRATLESKGAKVGGSRRRTRRRQRKT